MGSPWFTHTPNVTPDTFLAARPPSTSDWPRTQLGKKTPGQNENFGVTGKGPSTVPPIDLKLRVTAATLDVSNDAIDKFFVRSTMATTAQNTIFECRRVNKKL